MRHDERHAPETVSVTYVPSLDGWTRERQLVLQRCLRERLRYKQYAHAGRLIVPRLWTFCRRYFGPLAWLRRGMR